MEVANPIPFAEDRLYRAYDRDAAQRFWRILVSCDAVFKQFRARFLGKNSPVQFFWGSFDLAVTRFSGRRAPERPGADPITREAYSHEVISAGWWPGGSGVDGPAFYCYAAPEPEGLDKQKVLPEAAFYHPELKEFILMYDAGARGGFARANAAGVFAEHLRGCGDTGAMEEGRAGGGRTGGVRMRL